MRLERVRNIKIYVKFWTYKSHIEQADEIGIEMS
jgi:hypothetical protein